MASDDKLKKTDDERKSKISDYLQAPRRKRKNYAIVALGKSFPEELKSKIINYISEGFDGLATSSPKTGQELAKQFGRNISLLIIDDEFEEQKEVFRLVEKVKTKRSQDVIPILFMTRNPTRLVKEYHKNLLAYHEVDEYFVYPSATRQELFSRIRAGIESQNKRRGRRYKISYKISFFHLNSGSNIKATMVDLSAYGTKLHAEEGFIFKEGDQIRLSIPTKLHLGRNCGDFLKVSARVRRVFISGNHAAASFEYLSSTQSNKIVKFLSSLATKYLAKEVQDIKNAAIAAKNQ